MRIDTEQNNKLFRTEFRATFYELDRDRVYDYVVEIGGVEYISLKSLYKCTDKHSSSMIVDDEIIHNIGYSELIKYIRSELTYKLAEHLIERWETQ